MEKCQYLENWNLYWQSYLNLNPDLRTAGINDKQTSKNHYIRCGKLENRLVTDNDRQCIGSSGDQLNGNISANAHVNISVPTKVPAKVLMNSLLLVDSMFTK